MNKRFTYTLFIFLTVGLTSCKKPYLPTPVTAASNYLVVEGLINITDSTYIRLSRTVSLNSSVGYKAELKATVSIENNHGSSYALKELGNGYYASPPLNLSATNQYRIRVKTSGGNTYTSDFDDTKVSPQIDSVTWKALPTGLEIYADTHDVTNNSRYYRWEYSEGWEFHVKYQSFWMTDGYTITQRPSSKQIYDCYAGNNSATVILGSSVKLNQDVIVKQPIAIIATNAERIGIKYSIEVKQYALSKQAYQYWTLLKANTEQLGSVFDAQPSTITGNLHNINNTAEVVLGYISAGTFTTQRIFISKSQLPINWVPKNNDQDCGLLFVYRYPQDPPAPWQDEYINFKTSIFAVGTPLVPIDAATVNGNVTGWNSSSAECADCTLRGKPNPPAYWK